MKSSLCVWRWLVSGVSATAGRLIVFAVAASTQAPAKAQEAAPLEPSVAPIKIILVRPTSSTHAVPLSATLSSERRNERLARSMASGAHRGLLGSGIETAKEALLECQKGDYPGGGMGLLSMPLGRPSSRTDHCFR